MVDDSPNVTVSGGTSHSRAHAIQASMNFSSDDYDNSGYDFQSWDSEELSSSTGQGFHSSTPEEMRSLHSTYLSDEELGLIEVAKVAKWTSIKEIDLMDNKLSKLATCRRRCRPVAGGSPFVACCYCSELLQLPNKILPMKKNQKKVRCGTCSMVIPFAVVNKKLVVSVHDETEKTPEMVDDSPNVTVSGGTWHSRAHAIQASMNFSSDDYDNLGYDFQSWDSEEISLSTYQGFYSSESEEMRSPHSTYISDEELGLIEVAKVAKWTCAKEIDLMDNKLSELPENPKCPALEILLLHNNYDLMEIPQLFFEDMPLLQILDLSYTSIKSLPPSISRLKSLQTFNLRGCALLMVLPLQIGALGNLEVFDLEGTEIMYLPKEIGELINLRCLRVSFCGRANRYKEFVQMDSIIPTKVFSKLSKLEELSIDVNAECEWWDADAKVILHELGTSKKLKFLKLYLPSIELLHQLRRDSTKFIYPYLSQFRFIVGHHRQRIISRLPYEVEEIFKKWDKSKKWLEYINGEGMPTEITEALNHASVFFLDRHWTVKMLSEFGNENMLKLETCLLVECDELQTIIDGDYEYPLGDNKKPVFSLLRYLGIHYMRNLQSIWKGPIDEDCLSNLRSLSLHTCPNLTTIFRPDFLSNLRWLEELIVEDCCKIKSLVSGESSDLKSGYILRKLKRISLLDIPELVSISGCLIICPVLESLIVYNCPKLESLNVMEVSSDNLKIKGEKEWWDTLKWHESKWSNNTCPVYEELGMGEDLIDQLATEIYS